MIPPIEDVLGHLIAERGMTQSSFARAVGLSRKTINNFVRGNVVIPLRHVEAFADALRLTGTEREVFITEVHLTHATPRIREEFRRMQQAGGGSGGGPLRGVG